METQEAIVDVHVRYFNPFDYKGVYSIQRIMHLFIGILIFMMHLSYDAYGKYLVRSETYEAFKFCKTAIHLIRRFAL